MIAPPAIAITSRMIPRISHSICPLLLPWVGFRSPGGYPVPDTPNRRGVSLLPVGAGLRSPCSRRFRWPIGAVLRVPSRAAVIGRLPPPAAIGAGGAGTRVPEVANSHDAKASERERRERHAQRGHSVEEADVL